MQGPPALAASGAVETGMAQRASGGAANGRTCQSTDVNHGRREGICAIYEASILQWDPTLHGVWPQFQSSTVPVIASGTRLLACFGCSATDDAQGFEFEAALVFPLVLLSVKI